MVINKQRCVSAKRDKERESARALADETKFVRERSRASRTRTAQAPVVQTTEQL